MLDADTEKVLGVGHHVVENRNDVSRADVAAAQTGCSVIDFGDPVDRLQSVLAGDGVAE